MWGTPIHPEMGYPPPRSGWMGVDPAPYQVVFRPRPPLPPPPNGQTDTCRKSTFPILSGCKNSNDQLTVVLFMEDDFSALNLDLYHLVGSSENLDFAMRSVNLHPVISQ